MNSERATMLTTIDNPYNPFIQWDDWFAFDVQAGHHTCAYLARIANVSDELSDADYVVEVRNAQNEIVSHSPMHILAYDTTVSPIQQ